MANKPLEAELKLTDEFRRTFQCSKPESVVAAYETGSFMSKGKLFISQNFVCHIQGKNKVRLAYSKIESIQPGPKGGVNITGDDKKVHSFEIPPAGVKLLIYMWENPPSYIDLEAVKAHEAKLAQAYASSNQSQSMAQSQSLPQVDLAAADELLSLALDSDLTQNNLMETVAKQGEQIDRMGNKIDAIDAKLHRADHLLKGIESYKYWAFGKNKHKKAREEALIKRTINVPPNTPPPLEMDCLLQMKGDFIPTIFVLDADQFKIVKEDDTPICGPHKLGAIDAVNMLAKPEHMHILIKGAKGPILIISSYLQVIVNQITSRSKKCGASPKVNFAGAVRKFEYQDDRVSAVAAQAGTPIADLISNAQAKKDMSQLDNTVDQVLELTRGITNKGAAMNVELDRQNAALAGYNDKVDGMVGHTQNMNKRLDHQNEKY